MATLKVEIKRKCAICGNVFLAKFLDSRYCSPKCQKIASARKKAEEKRLQRLDELKQRIPDARDYIYPSIGSMLCQNSTTWSLRIATPLVRYARSTKSMIVLCGLR